VAFLQRPTLILSRWERQNVVVIGFVLDLRNHPAKEGASEMKRTVFALSVLAALGLGGAAFAEDARTGAWSTTTEAAKANAPTAMSDGDMDKVTAGAPGNDQGQGQGQGPDLTKLYPGQGQGPTQNNENGRW
jgi:hypothetical protein